MTGKTKGIKWAHLKAATTSFNGINNVMESSGVRDWEGHLLHRKRRMVFVEGTPPAEAVKDLQTGDCLWVLGIPRLNLALLNYRVNQAREDNRAPLSWNLPYEIIVVGVYDSQCEAD